MPEGTEFSGWGVPNGWRKWIYSGAIGLLVAIIIALGNELDNCWDRNDELRDKSDLRLEKWVDKVMENRLNQAESERINPKIEEVREIVDSLKAKTP